MADSNSFLKIVRTRATPSEPATPRPKQIGLPIKTAFAPNASAFKTSVPRRIPPSILDGGDESESADNGESGCWRVWHKPLTRFLGRGGSNVAEFMFAVFLLFIRSSDSAGYTLWNHIAGGRPR